MLSDMSFTHRCCLKNTARTAQHRTAQGSTGQPSVLRSSLSPVRQRCAPALRLRLHVSLQDHRPVGTQCCACEQGASWSPGHALACTDSRASAAHTSRHESIKYALLRHISQRTDARVCKQQRHGDGSAHDLRMDLLLDNLPGGSLLLFADTSVCAPLRTVLATGSAPVTLAALTATAQRLRAYRVKPGQPRPLNFPNFHRLAAVEKLVQPAIATRAEEKKGAYTTAVQQHSQAHLSLVVGKFVQLVFSEGGHGWP